MSIKQLVWLLRKFFPTPYAHISKLLTETINVEWQIWKTQNKIEVTQNESSLAKKRVTRNNQLLQLDLKNAKTCKIMFR